ncbi:MAG: 1,4-alpha-glucan branching enzyme, partial [Acetobacteraceae bacterium]|nr:1,4-alpha-glucan branching enzyme [Acetobacteraceae bacterium]
MNDRLDPIRLGAPDDGAMFAIVAARHGDPFAVLGPHQVEGGCAIRAFLPDATAVEAVDRDSGATLARLDRIHAAGFWCGMMPARIPYRLRVLTGDIERLEDDPYAFGPTLGDLDLYLLAEGRHHNLGNALGGHLATMDGVSGARFAVWAPNARRVSVVGSFNGWDGRRHPMRLHQGTGVWEMFIPHLGPGVVYKYELVGPDGQVLPLKADPVAACAEPPPATASVLIDEEFAWGD